MKKLLIIIYSYLFLLLSGCSTEEDLSSKAEIQSKENPIVKQNKTSYKNKEIMLENESLILTNLSMQNQRRALILVKTVSMSKPMSIINLDTNTEKYQKYDDNPVNLVSEQAVSTFSIDVDTASYSNVRRLLMQGTIPPRNAVKIEELINYFDYDYSIPENLVSPFSVTTEIAPTPWNKNSKLLHIGIKAYDVDKTKLPAANLIFLVDVSGSMNQYNKLDLVKKSLKLLLKQLSEKDKISLVTYAGSVGVVLEPTSANQRHKIELAIDQLRASGSTNGEAGIKIAYDLAAQSFIKDGINRVIIASDGDMNVGISDTESLKELIEKKRKSGIALTTLGFGSGNYNYDLMEQLADAGNGTAVYIDNLLEAQKVLVNEMSSTLLTIAKDVKIQIEFSPKVKEYRLIGYENRMLKREDFNNDKVDAGDIGAGHTVTALYEIVLADQPGIMDPLRYTNNQPSLQKNNSENELAFLKIRYKNPHQHTSHLISKPILMTEIKSQNKTSQRFKFSASVAAYGQILRDSKYMDNYTYADIIQLAKSAKGQDEHGYRAAYIELLNLASNLSQ